MKKDIVIATIFCIIFAIFGCGNITQVKGDTQSMENVDIHTFDDKEFLVEVYGFTEEELAGIDIERFKKITRFRENIQNSDELKRQFSNLRDSLLEGDHTDTFLLLTVEAGEKLQEGTEIEQIGFYLNAGTFVQKSLFDVEKNVFYVDDDTAHPLSEDLSAITDKYEVYKWKNNTRGSEHDSTGSYEWKLVFKDVNGTKYVYSGYTKDGSHLPDTYSELSDELISIIKG